MKHVIKALFEAKKELKNPAKTARGNFGDYTPIGDLLDTVQPTLEKHGLLLSQLYSGKHLRTVLWHVESGEILVSEVELTADKPGPQGMGSATTYFRRYSIFCLLGLASEEDPDAAPHRPTMRHNAPSPHRPPSGMGMAAAMSGAPISKSGAKQAGSSKASSYVVTFGKHKDKTMAELGLRPALDYAAWLEKDAAMKNKPLAGAALEFCAMAESFRDEMMDRSEEGPGRDFAPIPNDEEIPF